MDGDTEGRVAGGGGGMRVRDRVEGAKTEREPRSHLEVQPADSPAAQSVQLERFFYWVIPLIFVFTLLEGVAFLAFRDANTGVTGAVLFGYGCMTLVAWMQARRDRHQRAVILICTTFLGAILVVVLVQPSLILTLVFSPLLAVAVALPYVTERILDLVGAEVFLFVHVLVISSMPCHSRAVRRSPAPSPPLATK